MPETEQTNTTQTETTETETTQTETTDNQAVEVCESLLQQILNELKKLNKLFGGN